MALALLDIILLVVTLIIVIIDIILAICIRLVLPEHITERGWYAADGSELTFKDAYLICPCLIRAFPEGTKELIKFKKITVGASKRSLEKTSLEERMEQYPFLVSLSIPAYSDDNEQKIFACNGLIQSDDWLLTTKSCVKAESEWYDLTVRSQSPFWSKYGQKHAVIEVFHDRYEDLVRLKVFPPFAKNIIPLQPVKYPFNGDWTYATAVGWDEDMYKKGLSSRFKNRPFDIEEWTSKSCGTDSSKVCPSFKNCNQMTSKFLLTSCHQLLGIKSVDGSVCNRFPTVSLNIAGDNTTAARLHQGSECFNIYKDVCLFSDIEVCQREALS